MSFLEKRILRIPKYPRRRNARSINFSFLEILKCFVKVEDSKQKKSWQQIKKQCERHFSKIFSQHVWLLYLDANDWLTCFTVLMMSLIMKSQILISILKSQKKCLQKLSQIAKWSFKVRRTKVHRKISCIRKEADHFIEDFDFVKLLLSIYKDLQLQSKNKLIEYFNQSPLKNMFRLNSVRS